jgi:acylpyruvate hydrolase
MKFARYLKQGRIHLAAASVGQRFFGLPLEKLTAFGDLDKVIKSGGGVHLELARVLLQGEPVDIDAVTMLTPLTFPQKIVCLGVNYRDNSAETAYVQPNYPTIFARFSFSLIAHNQPIVRPLVSTNLDYEGEIVIVIGKGGRKIQKACALEHVFGYALFNDASIRDQARTPQWTTGKHYDGTGAFGPYIVTADDLPAGAKGLTLRTLLNGALVQEGNTNDMLFDVPTLIATVSEVLTLAPGDIIVSETPVGVGAERTAPLWMKPGDECQIISDRLGTLKNAVVDAV